MELLAEVAARLGKGDLLAKVDIEYFPLHNIIGVHKFLFEMQVYIKLRVLL